ncbi:MAG: PAS domain-containing protein [Verrucomicrobia bacterium]|nr:PAS domain-containing protein [Verrucomicrobiota bacterium]MCH8528718.1 PAS domain-containing protein [Kiritimatiellia bacterium]
MCENTFIYRVDHTDTIISVSENWSDFAEGNGWGGSLRPEEVVGRSLWDFIQGVETRHLYEELIRRVRAGIPPRVISFRCDSPGERRYMELLIEPAGGGVLQITSRILRAEARTPVRLLASDLPRSANLVVLCSMCKKMKISEENWIELEEGLTHHKIFETDEMPQLSHGLCGACYQEAMRDLEDAGLHENPA